MNWFERLQRLERKNRRLGIRRNVRAFRQRQKRAGMRRIDVALTAEHYATLRTAMKPGESLSAIIARMLDDISGNRDSVIKPVNNPCTYIGVKGLF